MNQKYLLFRNAFFAALIFCSQVFLISCGDSEQPDDNSANTQTEQNNENTGATGDANDGKGVGPVKNVDLGAGIDAAMADKGKAVFEAKCTACHNMDATRKVGPGLAGVTERRKPEWIMNMILNPEKMVQEDPQAKELLAEYLAPMANQNLSEEEARQILEYFRQNDQKK